MSQEPFSDIPLFREIQKILSSSAGPVNFEIARQVAHAVARPGASSTTDAAVASQMTESIHAAELMLSGYTRLVLEEPIQHRLISPEEWITLTLTDWQWLFEHVAVRLSSQIADTAHEDAVNPMQQALGQVTPLLLGIQMGLLVGHLSKESLARHDLPIPREGDRRLFFVSGNIERVASDYGFDLSLFRQWLALREVARQVLLETVPWINRYFRSLLVATVDALEIDVQDLERRLIELQSTGLERVETPGIDQALPVVETERLRSAIERVRAFLAVLEGYTAHASREVSERLLGSAARIEEGMARRQLTPTEGEQMLRSLLGLSPDRALEQAGETFCTAVARLKGVAALNRVWEAPDNLPTTAEIKDPFSWIDRVLAP